MGSAPRSPTKNGEMQEDQYWLIKYNSSHEVSDEIIRTPSDSKPASMLQPVVCHPCSFEEWQNAPATVVARVRPELELFQAMQLLKWFREKTLGRRIGDEVEMFEEGMKEEFADMRKDMEAKGLTVRAYVPQADSHRFPKHSHAAIMGDGSNTLISRCIAHLEANIEGAWKEKIEYGLIVDGSDRKVKMLCVARVPESMKDDAFVVKRPEFSDEEQMKVIGHVRNGKVTFLCNEDEAKLYFSSLGKITELAIIDELRRVREEELAALKAKKKEEKKHRRKLTLSTTHTAHSSDASSPNLDDSETIKSRQRAKAAAKKRNQHKARQAKKAAEALFAEKTSTDDSDRSVTRLEPVDPNSGKIITAVSVTRYFVKDRKTSDITSVNHLTLQLGDPPAAITSSKDADAEEEKLAETSRVIELTDDTDEEEGEKEKDGENYEGRMMQVVAVENMEEAMEAVARNPGRYYFAAAEDVDEVTGRLKVLEC